MTGPDDPTELSETRSSPAAPDASPVRLPDRIAGYRILRLLGAGGMGTVYEAHQESMNRRVALKIMARHQGSSDKSRARFAQEAWIAGKLEHPNLVHVFERGEWEDLSFYSMELVDGGSLADVIQQMKQLGRDPRLGLELGSGAYVRWAIEQVVTAARALDFAHRVGVVHRDVKPVNLLLSREPATVKVADFGLAVETDATRLTTTGTVLGTLAYMAPEQMLGRTHEVGPHTDVYALGATLFELLTLELPHAGKTQQLYMNSVLTGKPRRPREFNEHVSRDLEIVIRKALEKERSDRYPTAAALADDLENVLQFRPIRAKPPSAGRRAAKWVRRRPIHATLAAVLVLGIPIVGTLVQRAIANRRTAIERRVSDLRREVRWLTQRGRWMQAIEPANEVLRLDPGHVPVLQARCFANLHLARSATEPGVAAAFAADAIRDVDRLESLLPGQRWPLLLRAQVLSDLGRATEAEAVRARAVDLPAGTGYEDLFYEAFVAYDADDLDRAIELFTRASTLRPDNVDLILARAQAYDRRGDSDLAIQDYRLGVALAPDNWAGNYGLGLLLRRVGRLDEAEGFMHRAAELAPDEPHVHEEMSDQYLERGREAVSAGDAVAAARLFRDAEQEARRSLALRDDLPWARVNLGASLMERYRLHPEPALSAAALEQYDAALARFWGIAGGSADDAYRGALVNLCDALIQTRALDRALGRCGEAARAWPDNPVAHYNLAGAQALSGHGEAALEELEQDFRLGDRDWGYLKQDDWFESLRGDPRFLDLLERMRATDSPG